MTCRVFSIFALALLALSGVGWGAVHAQLVDDAPACPAPPPNDPVVFRGPAPITVSTQTGRYVFSTEFAYDQSQRSRGMMYRPTMAEDEAMLFMRDDDAVESFYMRNTCVALDLVWLSKDFQVVGIHANAIPFDETSLSSGVPIRYVLEIAGGRAAEIGLQPGDVVMFGKTG